MSEPQTEPICTVDPYRYLQIVQNPDGSITRFHVLQLQTTPATADLDDISTSSSPVLTKDLALNPNTNTWLRIFLPRKALDHNSSPNTKLPLILYYHAGGFIVLSASCTLFHNFCSKLADFLPAVIVSVGYRLAPEHRLPAAYDDAVEAFHWLKNTHDEWVRQFADVSNVYLMGSSAGGNIVYHVGLRVSTFVDHYEPLKIRGLILHNPFFGGSTRTGSELRLVNDPVLPLSVTDLMWDLALPIGADRDHQYCNFNPTVLNDGPNNQFDQIKRLGWRILTTGAHGDLLIDRQLEFVQMLKSKGVQVVEHYGEGHHTIEFVDLTKAEALFNVIKHFLQISSTN